MNIPIFDDSNQVPQPRENVRIESVEASPYPDRYRVFVEVQVTAFQERPNLLLVTRNALGEIINELDVIATMHAQMEFTMHMRGMDDPAGDYTLDVELFYESRNPPHDKRSVAFSIPREGDEAV